MKAEATPEAAGKSRALLKLRRAELVDRVHRRPRALAALCALNGEVFGWVLRSVTSCLFLGLAAASGTTQDWNGTTFTADGSVHGGDGIWNNVSTNFTDAATGTLSQSWQNGTAVFEANPGIITLGDNIVFQGLDFTSDEYEIRGTLGAGGFALEPDGVATVSADPGVSAIISAPISGAGGLDKQGPGTVVLSGTNSYSGTTTISATTISAGTLSVSTDANLGAAGAGITLNGGELLATGDGLVTTRPVFLAANGGTLAAASGGQAFFEGNITGAGPLLIGEPNGGGTVGLSGANTNTGTTTVVSGATLRAISLGALSSGSDFIVNGTLDLNGFSNQVGSLAGAGTVTNGAASTLAVLTAAGNSTFGGVLQDGPGVGARLALTKTGTGALILTGANTYSGGTTITAGTLEIGTNTVVNPLVGSIIGAVDNSSILNFINADSSGLTSVTTESGGSTHLLGSNTVGPAAVLTNAGGVFDISQTSAGVAIHSIAGAGIYDLGSKVLTVDDATSTQVSGMIQDGGTGGGTAGSLVKQGSGTLTLTGTNTYSGGTTINAGTLQI